MEINPGSKILRFPSEIRALMLGKRTNVLNVEIDLSNRCNANCAGCLSPQHSNENMTIEMAEKAISLLDYAWGTAAVVLTGGGEPTLCPDFEEIVTRFYKRFDLGLYTNGTSRKVEDVALAFKWVFVSLDAATPESYIDYKGVPYFNIVVSNIKNLAETKQTTVGCGFLISESNYLDIEDMARVGLDTGADYVHFRPLWPCNSNYWESGARHQLEAAQKLSPRVSVAWTKFQDAWHWERTYKTCWASAFIRCISADGKIWVCPSTRGKRQLGELPSGQVLGYPLMVTDDCRTMCRGHDMNKTLDYIMQEGGNDRCFV